jgi:hypothetical protein
MSLYRGSDKEEGEMAIVKLVFEKCIQDSQEYGSNDENMVSRVFFSVFVDGQPFGQNPHHADVKQAVGGEYERDPLEVDHPFDASNQRYSGPMSYYAYREAVEHYYRKLVGSTGVGIHIEGGSGIRMYDNTFVVRHEVEFTASDTPSQW